MMDLTVLFAEPITIHVVDLTLGNHIFHYTRHDAYVWELDSYTGPRVDVLPTPTQLEESYRKYNACK